MALYKCGGGGSMSETELWTNQSPASNFTAKQVTLSDDMDNYEFLKLTWKVSTTVSNESSVYWKVSDFKNFIDENNGFQGAICNRTTGTSYRYARRIAYISNTVVYILDASVINAASSNNALVIPIKISGVK